MNLTEREFLAIMLAAPSEEIISMLETKSFLGMLNELPKPMSTGEYLSFLAKTRRQWAEAMIAEATES